MNSEGAEEARGTADLVARRSYGKLVAFLVARTRDRARQRILEKLGWRFHRVWSTNWWFFEQQEKQAIVDAINAAREGAQPRAQARR